MKDDVFVNNSLFLNHNVRSWCIDLHYLLQANQQYNQWQIDQKTNKPTELYTLVDGVATVPIHGVIVQKKDECLEGEVSQEGIREAIISAAENQIVKEICLDISSPGGVAQGCQELAKFISEIASQKKIYASVDNLAASAAYWLASATGDIRVTPSAALGSIGVYCVHCDNSALYEYIGYKLTYIQAGKYKTAKAPKPLSDVDKEAIQAEIDHIYDNFKKDVANYMSLSLDDSENWAEGRVFFGDQAIKNGLATSYIETKKPLIAAKREVNMTENTSPQVAENKPVGLNEQETKDMLATAILKAENKVLALVEVILGEDAKNKVKMALSANLNAEQLAMAKNLFAVQDKPKVESSASVNTSENDKNFDLLANLSCAKPANAQIEAIKDEESERMAFINSIGNYGQEMK